MRRIGLIVILGAAAIGGITGLIGGPGEVHPSPAPARADAEVRELDIAFYERRVAEDSFSAADRARLANLYLQRARETGNAQDYDRAESFAARSVAMRTAHNAETFGLLTTARLAKHDFLGARKSAHALFAADSTNPSSRAQLAEVELELGNYGRAAELFASVARDVERPTIAARVARWYEITGRSDRARALLRHGARSLTQVMDVPREQVAWFHYRLGELEMRAGHLEVADSALQRALAVFPDDYRALGALSRLAAMRGRWNAAVEYGAKAIAIQLDPLTLGTMSDAYSALGDSAQARSFADAMATSALSEPGSIHRAWGLFLLDHDRDVERVLAGAQADLAIRRDVYAYDLVAWALYKSGRVAEAEQAAKAALAQGTADAQLFYHAGMIAVASGDPAEGRVLLRKAMALNPQFSPTQAAVARGALTTLGSGE